MSKLENKIVKVTSVFYETGIAMVDVFPDMKEKTVLVRTLEEIPFFIEQTNDFNAYANSYYDFLTFLHDNLYKMIFHISHISNVLTKNLYMIHLDTL